MDDPAAQAGARKLPDAARFLRSWAERPLQIGAVQPSGRALARTMASYVDPALSGPVIEIGPGTGPVTAALLRRGVAPERLVLLEFSPEFCALLRKRHPEAQVIEGDAYQISKTLAPLRLAPAAAVVSSLPLLTRPVAARLDLLRQCFALMATARLSCNSPTPPWRRYHVRGKITPPRRRGASGSMCPPLASGPIAGPPSEPA